MAKMKKLFAMFLTLCLIFSFSTTAFASSVDEREVPVASADFKRVCDQVFEGKGEVYNANGIDITNSFLTRYNAIYQSGNYDAILSVCFNSYCPASSEYISLPSFIISKGIVSLVFSVIVNPCDGSISDHLLYPSGAVISFQ